MQIAVVMDPIGSVSVDKDTSFALMLRAQTLGHRVYYLSHRDLLAGGGTVTGFARAVTLARSAPPAHAEIGPVERIDLAAIDAILVRTDPPFDDQYLYTTQLLELLRGRTLVVNDPRGLREANEKLYAIQFADVMPRTIVSSQAAHIAEFIETIGGIGVIKPLDGAGGRGVMVLDRADKNFNVIIELSTHEGKRFSMVQEFLPAVRQGDKRILLLDGEPLGAILRVPRADEARSNIHVGGSVEPTDLTAEDLAIVERLAPRLRADGLYFVGLDVIGGKLTEVNVTSPTGIQEVSRFTGSDPERKVIEWIERRAAQVKASARAR